MSKFQAYPAYKDSGVEWVGEVPEHWSIIPLKHVITLNPQKSEYKGRQDILCSFVPMEKLKMGTIQLDEYRTVSDVFHSYTYFENNDVLQAKVTPCFENKNVAIAEGLENGLGFGSSEINVLRPSESISRTFLFYRVQEDNYMSFCTASMLGAGGLKRVPTDIINNFKVGLPGIEEQTQIARFLDHETARMDALIAEQERLIELLKEKHQAVISHAVTKGLNPNVPMKDSGVEWLGDVPEHWEVVKNKYIFTFSGGLTITRQNLQDEGVPCISYGEIHSRYGFSFDPVINPLKFVSEDYLESRPQALLNKGDFVFADTSEDYEGAGNFSYLSSTAPVFAGYHTVIARLIERHNPAYLAYMFDSQAHRAQIQTAVSGIKVFSVTQSILKNTLVWLPHLEEQTEIARFLDQETTKLDALITEAQHAISLIKERRSALISAAVTGKIDVRNWQPEAEQKTA